jgi:hypothetical protein
MVMAEADSDALAWDLEKHLNGCVAGYQADPAFSSAAYFAFEAIWGIILDVESRAPSKGPGWATDPRTKVPVDFIWLRALAEGWRRYRDQGMPLGRAFCLEGGQGKPPTRQKKAHLLDQRAIAHWLRRETQQARLTNPRFTITDAIGKAVEHFGKSEETIKRAWTLFSRVEKKRTTSSS